MKEHMKPTSALDRFEVRFEQLTLAAVRVLLMIAIALTVLTLAWLLVSHGVERLRGAQSVPDLQVLVVRAFGGALLVLLGLELLESLRIFFVEHHVRVELILIVATIAVGRHIILLDFEHADGRLLIGVAALVLALTGGSFLVRRSPPPTASVGSAPSSDSETPS